MKRLGQGRFLLMTALIGLIIAGCGEQTGRVLPTQINLDAPPTAEATPTAEALAVEASPTVVASPTMTATSTPPRLGPTLPPTYTPTASPTPFVSATPTDAPAGYNPEGTLYYIHNGDTIMRLSADGSQQTAIRAFPGSIISELIPSPDGTMLAFVLPGAGSAREIWATNRDGSWLQQITCLNYADLRSLRWSPDSQSILFFGAQQVGDPARIYAANWIGANDCPYGNRQRIILRQPIDRPGSLDVAPDGRHIAFSDGNIRVLNLETQALTDTLTLGTGFGTDFALAFSPVEPDLLAYIRPGRSAPGARTSGVALGIRLEPSADPPRSLLDFDAGSAIQDIAWSHDGRSLLTSSDNSVFTFDTHRRVGAAVVIGTRYAPRAVFSPDGERIAYIDAGADGSGPQIVVSSSSGANSVQISSHESGNSISHLLWLPG